MQHNASRVYRVSVLTGLFALFSSSALAQAAFPGSAQPGRIEEQIRQNAPAQREQAPLPQVQQPSAQPEQNTSVTFTLNSVSVEGSTVYLPADLERAYQPLIGQRVNLAQIQNIARQLTEKYRKDGYVLSQVVVPQQNITEGNVRLVAIEGYVSNVVFEPEKGQEKLARSKKLLAMAEKIKRSRPLTNKVLERELLLMNSLPGVTARALVKASQTTPRAADLFISLSEKRVAGSIQVDNRGSRYYGPLEVIGTLNVNQIFDESDAIRVRGATTYQTRELVYGELHYQRMLNSDGLVLDLSGSAAQTRPGGNLAPFDIEGHDNNLRAQLIYPYIKSRDLNANVYGTLDYHNVSADLQGSRFYEDKIRTVRVGTVVSKKDYLLGEATNTATLEVTQGLGLFDATERGSDSSRPQTDSDFLKVNGSLSRAQNINNSNFSAFGTIAGQYGFNPQFATEEFGLGGEAIGSGYDPSEITGDSGLGARLELRYDLPIAGTWLANCINQIQPYAFYDIGKVWNRDPLIGQSDSQSLSSAGGGARLFARNGFAGSVEVAQPLTRGVAANGFQEDTRVFFKLSKTF